jgi:hypothetical protein
MGMSERYDRLAREREEIAARVANFKATQEKFRREREEYFTTTLENARHSERSVRLNAYKPGREVNRIHRANRKARSELRAFLWPTSYLLKTRPAYQ